MISNIAELNAVYPRWRGELTNAAHQGVSSSGLSPLARGTRHMPDHMCSNGRFIPAGAGNFATGFMQAAQKSVYPRWRGELCHWFHAGRAKIGLSPLARGTHILIGIHELRPRFIPAGAGNSATRWQSSYPTTVYPRWRGELFFQLQHCCCIDGLSPLARGTLNQVVVLSAAGRFIPAGAGNSARQAI